MEDRKIVADGLTKEILEDEQLLDMHGLAMPYVMPDPVAWGK
jgi:hypothetical protein